MIAKHVAMKSAQNGGFEGLVKYITDSQSKSERVGDVRTTNCNSDRAETAMLEVLNVQSKNKRSTADKNYHLVISFAQGESPDEKTLIAIEERICAAIGFAGHQRISVAHHDTDSLHVHVAINKIHPKRYTIHEPFNAYHRLGKICTKLEKEFGLQQVDHSAKKTRGENGADDMERHADVESLLGWIRRDCTAPMQNAQNWLAMHAVLRAHGLTIHERANGLVISSVAGVSVKASSVAREFSKASLEMRLGTFAPSSSQDANQHASKQYVKQPLRSRVDTSELYARYKDTQQEVMQMRADAWEKARTRKHEGIEAAKRKGRLKRAAIKLLNMPGIEKRILYAATSRTLLNEIDDINKTYLRERKEIYDRCKRSTWSDWLLNKAKAGNKEALAAMRARPSATGLKGNTMGGAGSKTNTRVGAEPDTVTRSGTIIYHVGDSAIRDDGHKLKVSRGADQAGLEAALRMAIERYGNCITVNGSAAFKESIVRAAAAAQLPVRFDDAVLERRRRQLTQPLKQKESKHGNASSSNDVAGRPGHGSDGSGRNASASLAANAARHTTFSTRARSRHAHGEQPDAGSPGREAPPPHAHGVRGLSKLGMVHVANGSEMLLPGDVPGHVEHQGTKPDHRVRRHLRRPGRLTKATGIDRAPSLGQSSTFSKREGKAPFTGTKLAQRHPPPLTVGASRLATLNAEESPVGKRNVERVGSAPPPSSKDRLRPLSNLGGVAIGERSPLNGAAPQIQLSLQLPLPAAMAPRARADGIIPHMSSADKAAEKYVIEREQKRSNGFDIPKHSRYNFGKQISGGFGGLRQIDGQALVLLKVSEEIFVLPVDESTAHRLKRIPVGQQVAVKAHGAIRTKGRKR